MKKKIGEILWIFSEFESLFSKPNDLLFFRRLYLRFQKVKYGNNLWIGRSLRLLNPHKIILGDRCALGDFVKIIAHAPIQIEEDFLGASGLHLDSGTHEPITLQPKALPINIGKRVWCGINVTIIAGVTIGNDVVIGAGSLVCNDIPSNSIAVGVPAKIIKSLEREADKELWTWVDTKEENTFNLKNTNN